MRKYVSLSVFVYVCLLPHHAQSAKMISTKYGIKVDFVLFVIWQIISIYYQNNCRLIINSANYHGFLTKTSKYTTKKSPKKHITVKHKSLIKNALFLTFLGTKITTK